LSFIERLIELAISVLAWVVMVGDFVENKSLCLAKAASSRYEFVKI